MSRAERRSGVRSKDIGTRAETAVVKLAQSIGFHDAERLPLAGAADRGDIRLIRDPLVILEVKAGKAAQNASWSQIRAWLEETQIERNNAWRALPDNRKESSDWHGFLVTQRKGYGIGRVEDWCIWTIDDDRLCSCEDAWPLPSGMFPLGAFLQTMKEIW